MMLFSPEAIDVVIYALDAFVKGRGRYRMGGTQSNEYFYTSIVEAVLQKHVPCCYSAHRMGYDDHRGRCCSPLILVQTTNISYTIGQIFCLFFECACVECREILIEIGWIWLHQLARLQEPVLAALTCEEIQLLVSSREQTLIRFPRTRVVLSCSCRCQTADLSIGSCVSGGKQNWDPMRLPETTRGGA